MKPCRCFRAGTSTRDLTRPEVAATPWSRPGKVGADCSARGSDRCGPTRSHVLHDWLQPRRPCSAGCGGCFTWNPRATLDGSPRAPYPGGSPGWADHGMCSAADARRVGHADRPGRPEAAAAFAAAPAAPAPSMFQMDRRQRPGRSTSVRSGRQICLCLTSELRRRSAIVLDDRYASIRPARFHVEPRRSSVAVAGRSGCPIQTGLSGPPWSRSGVPRSASQIRIERLVSRETGPTFHGWRHRLDARGPSRDVEPRRCLNGWPSPGATRWIGPGTFHVEPARCST